MLALGQVDGSVIPGMVGLEAGQSSFGDVYAMFRRVLEFPVRNILPQALAGKLSEEEIQTVVEETCDRIIAQLTVEAEKIPIEESTMIATDWINGRRTPDANQLLQGTISGFTLKSPFVMQTMSDVLGMPIKVCNTDQACALGAAMFAATASGVYDKVEDAIAAMNSGFAKEYLPDAQRHEKYRSLYDTYLKMGAFTEQELYR